MLQSGISLLSTNNHGYSSLHLPVLGTFSILWHNSWILCGFSNLNSSIACNLLERTAGARVSLPSRISCMTVASACNRAGTETKLSFPVISKAISSNDFRVAHSRHEIGPWCSLWRRYQARCEQLRIVFWSSSKIGAAFSFVTP